MNTSILQRLVRHLPFPEQASSYATRVDQLYLFLIISTVGLAVLLAVLVIAFAVRYHRRSANEIPEQIHGNNLLEFGWTGATLFLFLCMFFYGAKIYFDVEVPPRDALEIYVTGKQWMWKVQHPGGEREINALHVPVGRAVRITMTSQDVIHSFFVPAFRVKQDAVPGRYSTLWFTPVKAGRYHLFCAEYCGTKHSGMVGWVYALEPAEYSHWLRSGGSEGSLASQGEKLYHQFGCSTCHDLQGKGPGPGFVGLYGSDVRLENGSTVRADDAYLRESILQPQAKVVLGFQSIMPVFQGQLDEEQIRALVEFVKALGANAAELPSNAAPGSTGGTGVAGSEAGQR